MELMESRRPEEAWARHRGARAGVFGEVFLSSFETIATTHGVAHEHSLLSCRLLEIPSRIVDEARFCDLAMVPMTIAMIASPAEMRTSKLVARAAPLGRSSRARIVAECTYAA
jgi:hypothetical protein